jgi:hypothetical protein
MHLCALTVSDCPRLSKTGVQSICSYIMIVILLSMSYYSIDYVQSNIQTLLRVPH